MYALHGICLGFAKRCANPSQIGTRRALLVAQLVLLLVLTGLMGAKSF